MHCKRRSPCVRCLAALASTAAILVAPLSGVVQGQTPAARSGLADLRPMQPRTVAVIPFANITGNPSDDWLGVGIAETVITDLNQRFEGLSVIESDIFADALNPSEESDVRACYLARRWGVSFVVSGGFQRVGDQLRITARILDVETGAIGATVKVDGQLSDLFELEDRVVAELSPGFGDVEGPRAPSAADETARNAAPTEDASPVAAGALRLRRASDGASGVGSEVDILGQPGVAFSPSAGALPEGGARGRGRTAAAGTTGTSPAVDVTGGIVIGDARSAAVGNAAALTGRMNVRPTRTQEPPQIDGRLDDVVWRDAALINQFVQREPFDGAPATEATEVYIAYDSSNIYFGFYAHYEDPSTMRANRSDRDQAGRSDDIFSVYFDTFLDQQRGYVFSVNGYGVQDDSLLGSRGGGGGGRGGYPGGGGGAPRGDVSFDALFSSGGQLVEDGFTAEMAIPFKSLRYPARGSDVPHRWGFQVVRRLRDKNETIVWSPTSRDISGFLTQMGVLDGMIGLSTSRNLEMQPTFTGVQFGTLNEETGRVVDGDPKPEGGVNIKYGVTSNITLDFTLNPDFSQVESDRSQIEVNQRFPINFPELRPFFLEGAEVFRVAGPIRITQTRTISDPLYGVKITGKSGNTTLGVLYANDEAPGNVDDPLDPAFGQSAQTFVGRVRYDLYSESFIGAVFTDREGVDRSSRLAGIDSNLRIGNTHSLGVRASATDHRDEDGPKTNGYFFNAVLRKNGRNLSYQAEMYSLSPDFETDVGFIRRTDLRRTFGRVEYEWWPQGWLISWGPTFRYGRNYDFDRVLEDEEVEAGINFNFDRNIRFAVEVNQDMERFEGTDYHKRRVGFGGNIGTSQKISVGGGFDWGDQIYFDRANPFLGHESSLRININLRPLSRFQSNININTSRFTDPMGQFIPGINEGDVDENGTVFNVNIFRALSTYQFSERLLLRNIAEFDTFDKTLDLNFLLTYRVNSGTALFFGYDDHYQQREQFDDHEIFPGQGYQQTNRAVFTKFQYLFRF